ncbi:transporter [Rubrivirga sp. SAORIC476]|uniref:formate/nitrite transporter family protein n=1 Tax=Rubrivirga sp. SAORIC476 TaxID=1961794 RepID=UPI000BA9055B|nr:formate/nitrite transporter family protein [Rubrivirga sp. SAORIC476]MAQ94955.1 transporter [Rhodothermaceae bacterium]MBC12030.1 transporter [Rhodothermaceae bacterium]PAP79733.1 transporter [Rubrivirga sp. SAORIC476]
MLDSDRARQTLDRSESGAPASGHAVRDLFSTDEIFQRVVATADEEFVRSTRLLFFSGLAAGLSIGLSFVARAALSAEIGDASSLAGAALYPVGFLLIVLGRYQLFTENTLTPVTLVLTRIAAVPALLRLWGIVLLANVLGAALVAAVLARTGVFDADSAAMAREIAMHGLEVPTGALFWKGVFAGWLVASMVWLNHAARDTVTRFFIVFAIMFLVPAADLFHCIIGACETLYLVFQGLAGIGDAARFFGAVVVGNTVGGVLLVAILNYGQTRRTRFPDRDCDDLALTWREFLFGVGRGAPRRSEAGNAPLSRDEDQEGAETGSMLDQPVSA